MIDCTDQMIDTIRWGYIVAPVLGEATTRSGAVNIAKGLCRIEGQLIGSKPQDGTVLVVKRKNVQVVMAADDGEIGRDARYCP